MQEHQRPLINTHDITMSTTLPDIPSKKKRINWKEAAGMRFGRWTVVELTGKKRGNHIVRCRCDCGNEKEVNSHYLSLGESTSCGCYRNEVTVRRNITHGMGVRGAKHPLFGVYHDILKRCKRHPRYKDRVQVCGRWMHGADGKTGLETFVADMGLPPSPKLTIERVNNDGPYSPDNCVWGTRFDQSNNRHNTAMLEHGGERMSISRWAIRLGLSRAMLRGRYDKGWSTEKILFYKRGKRTLEDCGV
jgi:hypothetical protein